MALPVLFVEFSVDRIPKWHRISMFSLAPEDEQALLAHRDDDGLIYVNPDVKLEGVLSLFCENEDTLPEGTSIPEPVGVRTLDTGEVDTRAYSDVICIMHIRV